MYSYIYLKLIYNISSVNSSSAPAEKAPVSSNVSAGDEKVTSPMPGTILSVNVKEGDSVKAGQILMILEAMKMENEILCPKDGTVKSLGISKGATVESGTLLCVIA